MKCAFWAVVSFAMAVAAVSSRSAQASDFETILAVRREHAVMTLLENIAPDFEGRGSVVASPSRVAPNYFRHWVRDAALVMDVVVGLLGEARDPVSRQLLIKHLRDYTYFSRMNQITPNPSGGLAEPLFQPNGLPVHLPWGRPQNDGPALRASTLIRFGNYLLDHNPGAEEWVRKYLYDGRIPTESVVKADLEYTAHAGDSSYDLWEEVYGTHFYTRMVQRKALLDGARFARRLRDSAAAHFYERKAKALTALLRKHWVDSHPYILATLTSTDGIQCKLSNLDIATLLAVHHGYAGDKFFSPSSEAVLATIVKIETTFQQMYELNHGEHHGYLIGRYPEDDWDGVERGGTAHPWMLATNAVGEMYYKIRKELVGTGRFRVTARNHDFYRRLLPELERELVVGRTISKAEGLFDRVVQGLSRKGDSTLARAFLTEKGVPIFPEQIHRKHGNPIGARELTWSCASLITAYGARL